MNYQARDRYQDPQVASDYDGARFKSRHGRTVHKNEVAAIQQAIGRYCAKPGAFLDIPTGTGRMIPALLQSGHSVIATDISEEMLTQASARPGVAGVDFRRQNAEQMDLSDDAVDYALCHRLMTHLPPDVKARVLGELARVTKHTVLVNIHFASNDPLSLLNRRFRPENYSTYPINRDELNEMAASAGLTCVAEFGTGWYERSSKLMVFKHAE